MQRVTKEELDDELACFELSGQTPKPGFVFVGRNTERQLVAEFLGEFLLQPKRRLVVDRLVAMN